jgi:hypothetical protein
MLIPATHSATVTIELAAYGAGILLTMAGIFIDFKIKARATSLLLGSVLLLIFCFCQVPYQFTSSAYTHFGGWENAEKELALSGGAFVMAGIFPEKTQNPFVSFLAKLVPAGAVLFSITILCFGVDHFLYAKDVATYIPSYIPDPLFWTYLAGAGLVGSGVSLLLRIQTRLMGILLGSMILTWFVMLHIPKVVHAHFSDAEGEVTSAFLALAYSGIAFAIGGNTPKQH